MTIRWSWDTSLHYGLDDRTILDSICDRSKKFYFLQNITTRYGAQPVSYSMVKLATNLNTVPRLRMNGDIPPPHHTPLWRGQEHLNISTVCHMSNPARSMPQDVRNLYVYDILPHSFQLVFRWRSVTYVGKWKKVCEIKS